MKLTKRGEYALRSLIALGVARSLGRESVRFDELVSAEGIPSGFLRWVLADLSDAGLVAGDAVTGTGFRLVRPASEVVVGDVVRLVEPAPVVPGGEDDGLALLVRHVSGAINGIFDKFTLADLVAVTVYRLRKHGADAAAYLSGTIPAGVVRPSLSLREEFLDGAGI